MPTQSQGTRRNRVRQHPRHDPLGRYWTRPLGHISTMSVPERTSAVAAVVQRASEKSSSRKLGAPALASLQMKGVGGHQGLKKLIKKDPWRTSPSPCEISNTIGRGRG